MCSPKTLFSSILLVAASMVGAISAPNVIYILADDLGYGDLSCYGQETLQTPNLDKLAQSGMRFTSHYSGATVCAPSRYVLLTGKHNGHAGIRDNGYNSLSEDEFTLAELFKQAGYQTACIGKWGVGRPPDNNVPASPGQRCDWATGPSPAPGRLRTRGRRPRSVGCRPRAREAVPGRVRPEC